jgi:hypothetical protein
MREAEEGPDHYAAEAFNLLSLSWGEGEENSQESHER